ncbi:WD repeat-containing protein 92 [Chionoecetes opilio]|uniref:WD repeat-containing protein 92 n=1 Tax=Chionoecetes opilio TaxID=41210 RepID=A0A8J5CTC4_CHIOP|nr:WD repeat-containing protein 92 [Chionoecetes opilio]
MVYELNDGKLELLHDVERPKALKCGTFGASSLEDRHLCVGDFDGKMEITDLQSPSVPIYSVQAHSQIVNTIDGVGGLGVGKGAPEIATGSRDGLVKVWDPRQKERPVITIEPREGSRAGIAGVWPLETPTAHRTERCFDRKDIEMNKLLATTLESKFHVFDVRTLHPEKGFAKVTDRGHKSTVWCGRHLPQNREIFVTTGGNGSVMLWKYSYPQSRVEKLSDGSEAGVAGKAVPLQNTALAAQPITSFCWSPDKTGLAVCSGLDQAIRVVIVTKLNIM